MKLLTHVGRQCDVAFQPVLKREHFEYIQQVISEHKQLACKLPGTEARSYWISFLSKGGGWPECTSALFMLFRPLDDHPNDPIVAYQFEGLPDGDWCWLRGEEYDNELSDDEFWSIFNKRRI